MSHVSIPLKALVPDKSNPRRTQPDRDAHHRLVASIKAHGLIHPLVVRSAGGKMYQVIAGKRRLAALREIHRDKPSIRIACTLRKVDADEAGALSLGENFAREAMHPLDEAIAFARLAKHDGKDAEAIASEFGVRTQYVLQRMKLAALAKQIGDAYRLAQIDTATAEAFAAVPVKQQLAIWKELEGRNVYASQVRHLIANAWISAKSALFDVGTLPPDSVSADLFGEDTLIEREAFLREQQKTLEARQHALKEDGFAEVIVSNMDEVRDRLWSMEKPEPSFEPAVEKKLTALHQRQRKLEKKAKRLKLGTPRREALDSRIEAIEAQADEIAGTATAIYDEQTKAKATVFLILDPDGSVRQECRVPSSKTASTNGRVRHDKPLDSDHVSDSQRATVLAYHAFAVRDAVQRNAHLSKVLVAMALHDKVRSEAMAIRLDVNDSTLHAEHHEGFACEAKDRLDKLRAEFDPFAQKPIASDLEAFDILTKLSDEKLDALIAVQAIGLLGNTMRRATDLVMHLAGKLKVNLREHWTPDADWLKSYRKVQLSELHSKLGSSTDTSLKHSELVEQLDALFKSAKAGKLPDKAAAKLINNWSPAEIELSEP